MRVFNKLVRDNIIDICKNNNQIPSYKILDDKEYKIFLNKKLKEETNEYLKSENIEELADILEVVEALANASGSNFDEVLNIKEIKANKNGKFTNKIFLKSVR